MKAYEKLSWQTSARLKRTTAFDYFKSRWNKWPEPLILQAFNDQRIRIDGHTALISDPIQARQFVDVLPKYHYNPSALIPENIPLQILFEDQDILVLNKQAGMAVHPGLGIHQGTLLNALKAYWGDCFYHGLVHRLDRWTSGLMVLAKNQKSHEHLKSQFLQNTIQRKYIGLLCGIPSQSSGMWDSPMGRDKTNPMHIRILREDEGGKPALTQFRFLRTIGKYAEVEFELHTGRTHQIRIHAAEAGCPIAGDKRYGTPIMGIDRHALHAFSLSFIHPTAQHRIDFVQKHNFVEFVSSSI